MSDLDAVTEALAPLYEVERELGHGAIATVYLARAKDAGDVVVKVLADDIVATLRDPDAFVSMVDRAGSVRHPALLDVVGAGLLPNGMLYYAIAYADGDTGRDRLRATGSLPVADIAAAGRSVASALAAAHAGGVHHGAVTPSHLRFTRAGLRLSDLGVIDGLIAAGADPLAIAGRAAGAHYLSPEQRANNPIDSRSDIYMLGATLYEFLTGKPPFGGRTTATVMASVLSDEPSVATDGGASQAPGHVVNAILRAIEQKPEDRWPSAEAFAQALEDVPSAPKASASGKSGCLPALVAAAALGLARRFG